MFGRCETQRRLQHVIRNLMTDHAKQVKWSLATLWCVNMRNIPRFALSYSSRITKKRPGNEADVSLHGGLSRLRRFPISEKSGFLTL